MSRLETRVNRLEQRLGGRCADCNQKRARVELAGPNAPATRSRDRDRACPECGHTSELITVQLSFDPHEPLDQPAAAS